MSSHRSLPPYRPSKSERSQQQPVPYYPSMQQPAPYYPSMQQTVPYNPSMEQMVPYNASMQQTVPYNPPMQQPQRHTPQNRAGRDMNFIHATRVNLYQGSRRRRNRKDSWDDSDLDSD